MSDNNIPKVHLLPCNINYDGPAPISNYFQIEASGDLSNFTSHFRGRKLVGKKVDLESTGIILAAAITKESMPDSATKIVEIQTPIESFIQWGHDIPSAVTVSETYQELLEIANSVSENYYI